jgi:hypothetical protein
VGEHTLTARAADEGPTADGERATACVPSSSSFSGFGPMTGVALTSTSFLERQVRYSRCGLGRSSLTVTGSHQGVPLRVLWFTVSRLYDPTSARQRRVRRVGCGLAAHNGHGGREAECALLDGLLDAVRTGESRAPVVSAEPRSPFGDSSKLYASPPSEAS